MQVADFQPAPGETPCRRSGGCGRGRQAMIARRVPPVQAAQRRGYEQRRLAYSRASKSGGSSGSRLSGLRATVASISALRSALPQGP